MWAGHAFSLDYRESRGHAYMLHDQDHTERVAQRPQPGACLHCHASIIPAYRYLGNGDVQEGFRRMSAMPWNEARHLADSVGTPLVQHPVSEHSLFDERRPGLDHLTFAATRWRGMTRLLLVHNSLCGRRNVILLMKWNCSRPSRRPPPSPDAKTASGRSSRTT
jgi:hypothetical protein